MVPCSNHSPKALAAARILLLAGVLLVLARMSLAEDKVVVAKLSLAEALSKAIGVNVRIKQAETDYLESLSNVNIANFRTSAEFGSEANLINQPGESGLDNLIYSKYSYTSLFGSQASVDVSPLAFGTKRGYVGLTFSRPLMRGKGRMSDAYNRLAAAQSDLKVRDKQYYLSKQETALRVIKSYYRAVQARDQIKVQENAVESAKAVADGTAKKVKAGLVAGIEATRFEIQVAQATNDLNLQRQSAKGAMLNLMLEIGTGVGELPELVDSVPEAMPPVPSLEEALEKALANRQELAISEEQITNQQRLLAIAKDQLRPSLAAVAGYNSRLSDSGFISRSLFEAGEFAAGLQYKIPLDRREVKERQQIRERELDVLQKQREYQREAIAQEVGQAYRAVESQRASLKIFSENLAIAETNLVLANRMVEEAGGTNRDILDAQDAITQTKSRILSAKTELYLAILDLKNAMGEQIFEPEEK